MMKTIQDEKQRSDLCIILTNVLIKLKSNENAANFLVKSKTIKG